MQVSVESTSALERRMTIQIPADQVDQEVENRLKGMVKTIRIDGFRPGKVPLKVIEQKFGKQVRSEVEEQVVRSALTQALSEQQISPAGEPIVESGNAKDDDNLEYIATFEVYPEVEPTGYDKIEVEKPIVEIQADDIDKMLEKLRSQRASWEDVDRPAKTGDKVVIDYTGSVDGEEFPGGKGNKVTVELGSGSLVSGFEDQLIGISPGEERTIKVTFPDDYHGKQIAGKEAQFEVKNLSVVESRLPELTEEFAAEFGVSEGGVETLRVEVGRNMERELEQAVKAKMKNEVFDGLLKENEFDVPASMVAEERDRLLKEMTEQSTGTVNMEHAAELFSDQARKRVKLGIIVNEIVKSNEIELDHSRVRSTVETVAASYENPEEVVAWYYQEQDLLAGIQAVVVEDQVVEWLLEQVKVTEKPMRFYDLMGAQLGA